MDNTVSLRTDMTRDLLEADPHPDRFVDRHIGPREHEIPRLLEAVGARSLDDLIERTVPASIRSARPLELPPPISERGAMQELAELAQQNTVARSYLGMGYHDCITPPVIRRNLFENPGWYTQYTPYQSEISQGRLEALLNFQTMVIDLTGLAIANASMLDEATAAAEAMTLSRRQLEKKAQGKAFFVSERCHPQTIAVVQTRAEPLGIEVVVGDHRELDFARTPCFGILLQYPTSDGELLNLSSVIATARAAGALVTIAADLLALTLLISPGELGADVVVGSSQRFGVPLGYGGPHAGFMATREEFKRQLPGRLVGVSRDIDGRPALRLALGTREQHIRRDRATSNICTAQVLLAIMASMYAVYHGPDGLRRIAERVHRQARQLAAALEQAGHSLRHRSYFDTLRVHCAGSSAAVLERARQLGINLRSFPNGDLGVALDETVDAPDLQDLASCFAAKLAPEPSIAATDGAEPIPAALRRRSAYLTHPVFHRYRSETDLLRYLKRLETRDLSLTSSMIPLGSCTMKLNAAAEMFPVSHPGFAAIHPFAPADQTRGYAQLHQRLEQMLAEITGFSAVSLMPNAGSQGEYAGLLVIRAYHRARGQAGRDVCLIPVSAHGTNPASAVMAGMRVVAVECDAQGNVDLSDLKLKLAEHRTTLAALMITYPSTHGVFEESIREICSLVHEADGQVYLDGANLNALVGICRPGDIGADVCHLNLHKTFCIPHGGGGPGVGPIGVAAHLVPFLPTHPMLGSASAQQIGPVSAAPFGSPSILPISYSYIRMMGAAGLTSATKLAILNANYIAARLAPHYPILYTGRNGFVAHECIIDLRPLRQSAGIEADDVAKRLIDYSFHAPTMSWPVAGTLMIEPTESEPLEELDRFCAAMIAIRAEIREIESGQADRERNLLKLAPHTASCLTREVWDRPYSRQRAAFPIAGLEAQKFWPPVARVDNVLGDRNLVCACPPVDAYV
jgi:glycine dehydrogenase